MPSEPVEKILTRVTIDTYETLKAAESAPKSNPTPKDGK